MCKSLFYLLIFLFVVTSSFGQDKQIEKKLDNLLTKHFKTTEPGCEVLVSKHGHTIYKKAFGSADLELNVPLNQDGF